MNNEQGIEIVEAWIGQPLPSAYREFLKSYVEQVSDDGTLLYGVDSIIERNETFETRNYAVGYLAVGDDSGGRCFLIPLDSRSSAVYTSDQGDMDPDGFQLVAADFSEWIVRARSGA